MSWSYSGDPASSDRDAVRWLVSDTETADQLASDEEIAWAVDQGGGVYGAALTVAKAIRAAFARQASITVGPVSAQLSQRAEQYAGIVADLATRQASAVLPLAGGISLARKRTVEADTDRVRPAFGRGTGLPPGVGTLDAWGNEEDV